MCRKILPILILLPLTFGSFTQASPQHLSEENFQYTVGPEDVLEIIVYGHDDLHKSVAVDKNGFISFPLIGQLQVAKKTTMQIADEVRMLLEKDYLYDAQVEVIVKEYRSKKITVLGEIENPGTYYLKDNTRLIDLLTQLNYQNLKLGSVDKLVVQRQSKDGSQKEEITIDLDKMLVEKEQSSNIPLRENDIVIFAKPELFTIYGEVNNPGIYSLKPKTTLLNAIAIAGGFTLDADPGKITILRKDKGREHKIIIDVQRITREVKDIENILLHPKDYIIIPAKHSGKGFILFDRLKISPSLTIIEEYYDNIFASRKNIQSDCMLFINPAVEFELPIRTHNIEVDYSLGIPRFKRITTLNNLQHNFSAQANLDFAGRLAVTFKENFLMSFHRAAAGWVSEEIGIIDSSFAKNIASIEAKRYFSKRYFLKIFFQNERLNFQVKEIGKDYIGNNFSSVIGYDISPKLSFSLEYLFDNANFLGRFDEQDSISHAGFAALSWEKSLRTQAQLKIGYKFVDFKGNIEAFHSPIFQMGIETVLWPFSKINLQFDRSLYRPVLSGRLLFIVNRIRAAFSRHYANKIIFVLNAAYQQNTYPNLTNTSISEDIKTKQDNFLWLKSKISYNLNERISFAFSYSFSRKSSSLQKSDITQNIFSGEVDFRF